MTQFTLANRLPFNYLQSRRFIKVIAYDFTRNTLIINCKLDRNTAVDISTDCISWSLKEDIYNDLRKSPFSLLIDGGSDY